MILLLPASIWDFYGVFCILCFQVAVILHQSRRMTLALIVIVEYRYGISVYGATFQARCFPERWRLLDRSKTDGYMP